jgi:hypothetical protein
MAYDPALGHTVLFGGAVPRPYKYPNETDPVLVNDTWIYHGKPWTKQYPASAPTPRIGALMVYDAALKSLVLYGGCGPKQPSCGDGTTIFPLSDTWTYGPTHRG